MPLTVTTKGPKSGACNVCGDMGPLTEDHTPPKGWVRPTQVELQHVIRALSPNSAPKVKRTVSQNGVKYRTLCGRCNNTLLGHTYDPHLISFANHTATLLQSSLHLPATLSVPARPQAIMRAVLGHIAAQGVNRYSKGPHTEDFREYILDSSLPFPSYLSMYYWAYPHRSQVLVRDASYIDFGEQEPFLAWFMKCFPLAFLITWDASPNFPFPVHTFAPWSHVAFNDEVELPINLHPLPPESWPEAPSGFSAILYGTEAVVARGLTLPLSGHPTAGHTGSLRQGR
jgi:hypothetical protein